MGRASVVVVSWNGEPYLKGCLEAILSQVGPQDEVMVVDNASADGSVALVRERYPQVCLIENEHNLGFAGGTNVGLRVAEGEYLISINQDVEIYPGWLEALLEMLATPGVGIAGCKLLYPDGVVQHAGGAIRWPHAFTDHYGYRQLDDGRWDRPRPVDYVTGAAWGFRREVVEQIGLLDEGYWPGYYEEVDYCFRARKAGWQVVYVPQAIGIHHESVSLERGSAAYLEALHRGRLRFVLKHCGADQIRADFLPGERRLALESAADERRILARAYFDTLMDMPDVLGEMCLSPAQKADDRQALISGITSDLSDLYLWTLHPPLASPRGETRMNEQTQPMQLPTLHEHDFRSQVPLVGPLIQVMRRALYRLTAKWGVLAVIHQQTRINQMIAAYLQEHDARLIDQDRDLAHLARTVAELEVRQRYLARELSSRSSLMDREVLPPAAFDQ